MSGITFGCVAEYSNVSTYLDLNYIFYDFHMYNPDPCVRIGNLFICRMSKSYNSDNVTSVNTNDFNS